MRTATAPTSLSVAPLTRSKERPQEPRPGGFLMPGEEAKMAAMDGRLGRGRVPDDVRERVARDDEPSPVVGEALGSAAEGESFSITLTGDVSMYQDAMMRLGRQFAQTGISAQDFARAMQQSEPMPLPPDGEYGQ